MAIHEHIRQDGEKERGRAEMAPPWSAIAVGRSWALRYWQKGYFMSNWKECQAALLENLGDTFGFIIVIMARQQLFTETP